MLDTIFLMISLISAVGMPLMVGAGMLRLWEHLRICTRSHADLTAYEEVLFRDGEVIEARRMICVSAASPTVHDLVVRLKQ